MTREIWVIEHLVNGEWIPKGSRTGKKEAEASAAFYNKKPGVKARAALYVSLEYVEENWLEPSPGSTTLQRRVKKKRSPK